MDKLKTTIESYGRWAALSIYVERIEAHQDSDFSHCLENAKALLEAISKEICLQKGSPICGTPPFNNVLRTAFMLLGFSNTALVTQISTSLANIGHQIGNLRNDIGPTAHGRTLAEMEDRNNGINLFTRDFLIETTTSVASLLIRAFEADSPRIVGPSLEETIVYQDAEEFNEYWDEIFGEFKMDRYSYAASEILYNVDKPAYANEYRAFNSEAEVKLELQTDSAPDPEHELESASTPEVLPEPLANESAD